MVVLTANLPPRKPSHAARWALRLAVFIPVLFVTSIIAHNTGSIDVTALLIVLTVAGCLCAMALLLWIIGLRSLWVHGRRGGRRLSWALLLLLPFLIVYSVAVFALLSRPAAMQASTDLITPPVFASEFNRNGRDAAALVAAELPSGSSGPASRRYEAPMEVVLERVGIVADQAGWRRHLQRGRVSADDQVLIEYRSMIPATRVGIEMVVRLTNEGDAILVDARSRSPELVNDLGYSRWSIDHFLGRLDTAMIGLTAF